MLAGKLYVIGETNTKRVGYRLQSEHQYLVIAGFTPYTPLRSGCGQVDTHILARGGHQGGDKNEMFTF